MTGVERDTTPVQCPNYCLLPAGFGRSPVTTRQFQWQADAGEDVGTMNYCPECGAELVDADDVPDDVPTDI